MLTGREDEEFDAKLMQRLLAEDGSGKDTLGEDEDAVDLAAMSTAMKSYRAEALAWAERRSAAMPSPLPAGTRGHGAAWLHAPQWVLGMVGLCACVVGGALYTHYQATSAANAIATLPVAPTEQALAADNQLLSMVDTAVSNPVEPSEQELGLTNPSLGERVQTHRHAQREN